MTRRERKAFDAKLAELGAGTWLMKSPATAKDPRIQRARDRNGKARVRLLRQQCRRGDFGPCELQRRIMQMWASI